MSVIAAIVVEPAASASAGADVSIFDPANFGFPARAAFFPRVTASRFFPAAWVLDFFEEVVFDERFFVTICGSPQSFEASMDLFTS
jgi:hypothetical protein